MTQEQYLEINAKGFEGDGFLKVEIQDIIKRNNIDTIIETGSFRGNTTKQFAEMVPHVLSIELNPELHKISRETCKEYSWDRVGLYEGSSEIVLQDLLPAYKNLNNKIFFFLDAHWNDYCPLRDELAVIRDSGMKPCIAIHDFKVPGMPFGYDTYKGQDYELDWIQDLLVEIYGPDFKYYYNKQTEGANRGVIFINC